MQRLAEAERTQTALSNTTMAKMNSGATATESEILFFRNQLKVIFSLSYQQYYTALCFVRCTFILHKYSSLILVASIVLLRLCLEVISWPRRPKLDFKSFTKEFTIMLPSIYLVEISTLYMPDILFYFQNQVTIMSHFME